jgi:Tfp pilus assembly protein FimT
MTSILSAGKILRENKSPGLRESGFTLIEIVSVLVLVVLLFGLVTPFVMTTLDRIQGDSSVRKLASILASARSQAVATKTSLVFQGNLDQNQYSVINPKTGKSSKVMELDQKIQFSEFNDGEESLREGVFSVTFYPLGSTSGGTILLEPTDADADAPSFVLSIDAVTGKPYIQHAS